jgi:beta-phosphoglucomutase-like phosphatase (HAD superfamily)
MVRAVVFDFDGVLANSEPLHFAAYRELLAAEGIALTESEYYERYLGFDDARAFEAIAADRGRSWDANAISDLTRRKAALLEKLEQGGQSILFPGARQAVERLAAAFPLAIASGALGSEIARVLKREALAHHFAAIVSSDDAVRSKPSPDPYLCAVDRLAHAAGRTLRASECVAVEDSPWGIDSARAAGLLAVAVSHTYAAKALGAADAVIGHLDELTCEFLGKLVSGRAADSGF